jgi:hypothetical protein
MLKSLWLLTTDLAAHAGNELLSSGIMGHARALLEGHYLNLEVLVLEFAVDHPSF